MKTLRFTAVVVLALLACGSAAAQTPEPTSAEKMKSVVWPGCISIFDGKSNYAADEPYMVAVKAAGFKAVGCGEGDLDVCTKHGLKAYLYIWPHEAGTMPAKYKDNNTILCYFIGTEKSPDEWGAWADREALAWQGDPRHPALFTMYALRGSMEQFPKIVRGRALEFYQYPWDAHRQPFNQYAILEQLRQTAAANGNMPICMIAETRPLDKRMVRHSINTGLVYGVRAFRTGGYGLFKKDRDATGALVCSIHGDEAVRFNQAINSFSPTFETATCVEVFHTAPLPPGTKEVPADHWVQLSGADIIMGEFTDPAKNNFLVLTNRDAFAPHTATLTFNDNVTVKRKNKVTTAWDPVPSTKVGTQTVVAIPLEDGGVELLQISL